VKFSEFIEKLQNQPEGVRKIILWSVVIIVAFCFFAVYIKFFVGKRIEGFQKERIIKELQLPELKEELKNLPIPGFEAPGVKKEELENVQEIIKESQE